MFPVALKCINKVLDLEPYPRLDLSISSLSEHRLEATLKVIQCDSRVLGLVLLFDFGLRLILTLLLRVLLGLRLLLFQLVVVGRVCRRCSSRVICLFLAGLS